MWRARPRRWPSDCRSGWGAEYISVAAVTAAYGFALTASPFGKRRSAGPAQRNQRSRPLRTAPR
ncbi:hypothetical protein C1X61_24900 [Pseudomonas sp. FW215-T2]|nr:hypothetical protein C1X61_24900 [Pseudomonas sp. FW215-T2]PNA10210.1 hypothetical protein C1X62_18885 [Pseudomonas sp. FW215-R3]PNB36241.1 hypothetical protein C1X63_18505 [Pseudomonas sp. FW305-131]